MTRQVNLRSSPAVVAAVDALAAANGRSRNDIIVRCVRYTLLLLDRGEVEWPDIDKSLSLIDAAAPKRKRRSA
jgi:predicted transcriptional regulator